MAETTGEPETLSAQVMNRLKAQRMKHLNGTGETKETRYQCRKCRDSGWYEFEKGGYTFSQECECGKLQRERIAGRLKFATIPKEFEGQTVENFRTDCYSTPHNREVAEMAKQIAEQYVKQFAEIRETGKVVFLFQR